jgi:GDP/UDP-N,N'-diacetylbacillosamine 2-epimerase (hydrolysing)
MKKNICIITGSRAEYGLQKKIIDNINQIKLFNLQLIVTGSHLSNNFNYTYKEIIKDGIKITKKIKILPNKKKDLNSIDILSSIGDSFYKFGNFFKNKKTDILIIFGDRYEMIAPAYAALFLTIPICHIHGGEITNGSIDDSIRHTITKLSRLHFVANKTYKKRVIQMGENPNNVFIVGGLGADKIKKNYNFVKYKEIEKKFNFKFNKINYLVTIHPETNNNKKLEIKNLLDAIKEVKNSFVIFTGVNADFDGYYIKNEILKYVKNNDKKSIYIESMGDSYYLSTMKIVTAVIGNSSSGIVEAPYFKVPTINIGNRQNGRIFSNSIVHCSFNKKEIKSCLNKINSLKFKKSIEKISLPYGNAGASNKICNILMRNFNLTSYKTFYDL